MYFEWLFERMDQVENKNGSLKQWTCAMQKINQKRPIIHLLFAKHKVYEHKVHICMYKTTVGI